MTSLQFDIAHLLAGGMLVLSLLLLYQDRILATLNVFCVAGNRAVAGSGLAGLCPGGRCI